MIVSRPGDEFGPGGHNEPVAVWNRGQGLLHVAGQGPPELVLVVVDHPVRPELVRQPGDAGAPRRPNLAARPLDPLEPDDPLTLVALEDVEGPVGGAVIGHDEDIRLNGLPAKVVSLTGDSPIKGPDGHPLLERDRLITCLRTEGTLFYVIFVSPDSASRQLAPTFDKMQNSLRVY